MPYLILIVLACMGVWYGGDGLWVSLTSNKLTTFNVETVEEHGIGNNRYIKITDGTWGSGIVYQYDQDTGAVDYVIFALESPETYQAIAEGRPAEVHVLVKKDAHTNVSRLEQWMIENGADEEKVEVQGVTLVGFDSIDDSSRNLIESMDMKISDDVVFLEEGKKPESMTKNLLIFIPSALFLLFVIYSFFRKEDETEEITETADVAEVEAPGETRANDCIKQVMILMMLADGEADLEEVSAIQNIYKQLTEMDYETAQLNLDIKQIQEEGITLKSLLKEMNESLSDDGKRVTFEAAFLIAAADSLLHPGEREMLKSIESALHIPDEIVRELCERHGVEDW
ncbi:TerB family tellurite resistance protein [Emcibacter nanhaiensis]|uniref:TerB family tellurite resistance protein n=1 Tax=Emcibacter nanhaiensis TaxID=1505037 RepID=A0A501PGA8_9PROT|nr:TerB family tellurite resistance protein [Emcibacter nanhaiensis]TPD58916.1 TerB family tellurite resistance protein [Emcibacter nanhaiensis]